MGPLGFYFDFASPYAWIAFDAAGRVAARAGRALDLRPMLTWAVLREHGIAAPMEVPVKRAYMLADMTRSAAFMGVPLRLPEPLPMSAHLATRLWIGMAQDAPDRAVELARAIFLARFGDGRDISDLAVLHDIANGFGISHETADRHIAAPQGREVLAASIARAVQDGVCGAPFFVMDGEGFFGADRLPHLAWRLGVPLG